MEFRFKGKRRQVYRPFILPNRGNVPIQNRPFMPSSKPPTNNVKTVEDPAKIVIEQRLDCNTAFENKKDSTKEEKTAKIVNNNILKKNTTVEINSEPKKTQMDKDSVIITYENNKSQQENITQKEVPIKKPVPDAKVDTPTTVTKPPEKNTPVKSVPPTVKSTPTINPPPATSKNAVDPEILKKLSVLDKEKIKRILQQNEAKKQFKKDDLENKVIGLVKNFMSNYEDNINSILSKNFQTNNSISTTITNTLCEAIDQIQETIPKPPKRINRSCSM